MRSSLEKRLDKLRQQREALAEQIRLIEKEKANELRKIRLKKESLVGAAVMHFLDKGTVVEIGSESDLLALLDGFLVRKTDRSLFGLNTPSEDKKSPQKTASNSEAEKKGTGAEKEAGKGSASPEAEGVNDEAQSSASEETQTTAKKRKRSSSRLPVKGSQSEMLDEFNV